MLEFILRIAVGLAFGAMGLLSNTAANSTQIGAVAIAFAGLVLVVDRKGLRSGNVASVIASVDSLLISFALSGSGGIQELGFFALAPCAYAATAFGSSTVAMAPIAAGGALFANFVLVGGYPSPALYGQALGILGLGLLMPKKADTHTDTHTDTDTVTDPDTELRQAHLELQQRYRAIETRPSNDHHLIQLFALREKPSFMAALAAFVRETCQVESVTLYSVAQFGPRLVVGASTGDRHEQALQVDIRGSVAAIKSRAEKALATIENSPNSTVVLVARGKVLGLIALTESDATRLEEGRRVCESLASPIALLIEDHLRSHVVERRLRETELLYEVATTAHGAGTPNSLAERVCQTLFEILDVDHLGVSWIDGADALHASIQGKPLRLLDAMSFSQGPGVLGWLRSGSPELLLHQTTDDNRCPAEESIRRRIGSFIAIPIRVGDSLYGILTVATHRSGGVDLSAVETCRVVADELAQAVGRLRGEAHLGLISPSDFAKLILEKEGACVFVEPLHVADLRSQFGTIAFARAEREFARRVRYRLPTGAVMCRRKSGALAAFLPEELAAKASDFATEVKSVAAQLAITTPDGSHRIPFAARARVAMVSKQSNGILREKVA